MRSLTRVMPLQKGEYAITLADGTVIDTGRTDRDVVERFRPSVGRLRAAHQSTRSTPALD